MFDLLVDSRLLKINQLIERLGWKQAQVARHLKMSQAHLSNLLNGKIKNPHENTLDRMQEKLAAALNEHVPGNFTIPRVSGVSAGTFREYSEDLMNREGVPGALYPYPNRDPMTLRVAGSSMIATTGESIEDGDDVIFANEFEEEIPDGEIVVARKKVDDTLTVKRLRIIDKHHVELVPSNPRYEPVRVRREEVTLRRVKVIINYRYKRQKNG